MSAKTAIYCRVSTPGQKNTTSLPEQERLCREKAARLGWEVSEPHVYHEVSTGADLFRPQMDRLWDAMTAHQIDAVLFDVLDRLGRDEGDHGALYHHAAKYGIQIELASEDIDQTEQGRNLRTLMGIVARMERIDIRRRTQGGRKARAAAGKMFPGSVPLYGYLWSDPAKKARAAYLIDPETAPIGVHIWERIAEGIPIRQLARELNAAHIPTPAQVLAARGILPKKRDKETGELVERDQLDISDMRWQPGMIGHILHHPAYVGQHSVYRYAVSAENDFSTGVMHKVVTTRERAPDDPERIALSVEVCPPLISPQLAARVAAQLMRNKLASAGNNPDPLATLWRGMAFCGHCGSHLATAKIGGSKNTTDLSRRRYRCASVTDPGQPPCPGGRFTIGAAALDPAAWADVVDWLSNPENVVRLLKEWEQEEQTAESSVATRLEAANAVLSHLRNRMTALADAISETTAKESRQVLQEKLDQLAVQVTRETGKRDQLLRAARDADARARDERDIREWACAVAASASEYTREVQRDTLRALGAQVTVWRSDHMHADGWPQRYKVTLTFTGFTGQPVTLPARYPVSNFNMLLPLPSGSP
jgi:DNA invertase Pin-like site-specific DNA recombinase